MIKFFDKEYDESEIKEVADKILRQQKEIVMIKLKEMAEKQKAYDEILMKHSVDIIKRLKTIELEAGIKVAVQIYNKKIAIAILNKENKNLINIEQIQVVLDGMDWFKGEFMPNQKNDERILISFVELRDLYKFLNETIDEQIIINRDKDYSAKYFSGGNKTLFPENKNNFLNDKHQKE